ncbi:MAG: DUF3467 domain-containing protein [Planctomycetes bacterium]|nr:DUF3467 domain-containing protein [Planctomycetota bacterium]
MAEDAIKKVDAKEAKDAKDAKDAKEAKKEGSVTQKPAGEGQQVRIQLDDSGLSASYSNFCRVTGTPEEVIIDFSLNPNPYTQEDQTIKIDHRLVLNHYTAKRLFAALQQTIMRHEQNFGVIELNVQRRLTPQAAAERK